MGRPPLTVVLSEWQKLEALKRCRQRYQEELERVEASLTDILTACAEADFLAQYLGEQPEIKELRARRGEVEALEKRRQYLIALLERLDAVMPRQSEVRPPPPSGVPSGLRRH